jgi:hypothetical protein
MKKTLGRLGMNTRMKIIATCVGAAIAQMASNNVRADSGVGVDTILGNTLNPYTRSSGDYKDPDGLGQNEHSRGPTGFLQAEPNLLRDPTVTASGWQYKGSVEGGAINVFGSDGNAKFREYKDVEPGLFLNNFNVEAEKPDSANFVEAFGGGLGNQDQYYGVTFGRYNDWKVKAFYNETPHTFTSSYKSLWSNLGSKNLVLNAGLTPGGTTNAATTQASIQASLANTSPSTLEIVRKKGSIRADLTLDNWKVFAGYSNEKREGSRPFGATFGGGGGGGNVEIPESIDNNTHDFLAGVQWANNLQALNVTANVSMFRNNIDTMTFENPIFATLNGSTGLTATTFTRGTFDLHPDNDFYNIKGEYAHRFPDLLNSRFTALYSYSGLRQDDKLIAPTEYPLTGGTVTAGGASLANNWNTTAALSQQSAKAKINTQLLDLGLTLNPINDLDVRAKVRYYETENKTEYWACNPLTGQWGRVINDGSGLALVTGQANATYTTVAAATAALNGAGCNLAAVQALGITPAAGNTNIRNIPYQYKQFNYNLSGDYRFSRNQSFNAAIERETFNRDYRERDKTWEDKLKVGYVNRSLEGGTVRLSLETDRRRGSDYITDPYESFYSVSMGPLPTTGNVASWVHNIAQFRKFDLADRDQNILNGRFNYALAPDIDFGVTLQLRDIKYPNSDYGRNDHQKLNSLGFDLNWQASTDMSFYGFFAYQDGQIKQANVQPNACAIGTTYSFWSNGVVNTGAAVAGATLVTTVAINAANWESICGAASATNPLYPTSRTWDVTQKDKNNVLGLGFKYDFGKAKLNTDYVFSRARTSINYGYNAAALGITTTLPLVGNGFSDLVFDQHILDVGILFPVDKRTALRLIYRYETMKIRDWHYDGVAVNPMPATNAVYLDQGPKDYTAQLIGLLVKVDF